MSQLQVFKFPNAGMRFVAADMLVGMGIDEESVSTAVADDPLAAFCCVDAEGCLRRVRRQSGDGHDFLSVAAALRDLPDHRDVILSSLCPGACLPALPVYAVNGCDGTWVTAADLACCAAMESCSLLSTLGIHASRTAKCFAFVDTDGSLTKAGTCRARGCGAMVLAAWVSRAPQLAHLQPQLGRAVPGAPIAMAAPPTVQQVGTRVKRPRVEGTLRMCSVKMTLTSRLKDPAARNFLEVVVDTVLHVSRFGSYLLNLHVMRLLDRSGGVLSDKPSEQPFCLSKLARKAMAAARCKQPKDAALAVTFSQHPVVATLVNTSLPDVGNTLHEAQDYVRNAYTTLQEAGPSRLAKLMKAAMQSVLPAEHAGLSKAVRGLLAFVQSRASSPPDDTPVNVVTLAKKYRDLYARNGLPANFSVHTSHSAADKDCKVRRILELYTYWHISCDLGGLVRRDSASPATFSHLPVSSLKRRHVTVDHAGFARAVCTVAHEMDVSHLDRVAFASLFVSSKDLGRRKVFSCIRSAGKGWSMGKSFKTDATSLVMTYIKNSAKQLPLATAPRDLLNCRIVGDDPGRVNIHTTCEKRPDGKHVFRQLTWSDYYRDAKLDVLQARRECRHQQHASDALAALSGTVRHTTDPLQFEAYIKVVVQHAPALRAAYAMRSACSEAFKAYRLKTKTMDKFIVSHGKSELGCPLVYGLGNAKFKCNGRGEQSVPTTAYSSRIRRAFSHRMILVPVDEYCTTKYCSMTHTELAPTWRPTTDGTTVCMDRDVKLCKSEAITALGSPHPCKALPGQLAGLCPFAADKWVPIDRDRNSALAIANLTGVAPEHRPLVYRRPSTGQPCLECAILTHSTLAYSQCYLDIPTIPPSHVSVQVAAASYTIQGYRGLG
jgi:hypothetical protein